MFKWCSRLTSVTCLATGNLGIGQVGGLSAWLDGVAANGVVIKAAGFNWPSYNGTYYAIPEGWTFKDYEP